MLVRFYKKHEKYLSLIAFFAGFTIDNLTLTRIDLWLDNVILASYLFLAALGIVFYQFFNRKLLKGKMTRGAMALLTLLIQFAFGGLFSGYFVFYSKSASLATSWWFVLFIIIFLIGNELFKEKYARLEYQVSIFFITLFSFAIFYVPIVLKSIEAWAFVVSGLVSILFIRFFIRILGFVVPKEVEKTRKSLSAIIFFIYATFNILYFTNVIPPIPLSLKDSSVHHYIERSGNIYVAQSEIIRWYEIHKKIRSRIHIGESSNVYVYSSVFAPTDLNTEIFHSWQYFDEASRKWIEADRFSYPIFGGRDGGYRGYTQKSTTFVGKWRVDIVTKRNQIIGRVRFDIIDDDKDSLIVTEHLR